MSKTPDILLILSHSTACSLYILAYALLALFIPLGLVALVFDAPFGRFSWQSSRLNINANVGWLIMETVSPMMFMYALVNAIITAPAPASLERTAAAATTAATLPWQILVLSACFLIHYFNRAFIFTITQPVKRSPMHLLTFSCAVLFNSCNGFLLGSWFGGRTMHAASSPASRTSLSSSSFLMFILGLCIWLFGFVFNIIHDQMLMNLRRNPPTYISNSKHRRSASVSSSPPPITTSRNSGNRSKEVSGGVSAGATYYIPRGYGFDRPFGGVSSPAYLCEWIEWTGFLIATWAAYNFNTPPPVPLSFSSSLPSFFATANFFPSSSSLLIPNLLISPFVSSSLIPPALFLITEITTMWPRAIKTHQWYRKMFGAAYPPQRSAIIPIPS